tara:strand:- start:31138 stop:31497 length:360 start_codon:yes stop_codon:yes gene_type:complete
LQSLSGQTEPLPVFYKKGLFGAISRSGQANSLHFLIEFIEGLFAASQCGGIEPPAKTPLRDADIQGRGPYSGKCLSFSFLAGIRAEQTIRSPFSLECFDIWVLKNTAEFNGCLEIVGYR